MIPARMADRHLAIGHDYLVSPPSHPPPAPATPVPSGGGPGVARAAVVEPLRPRAGAAEGESGEVSIPTTGPGARLVQIAGGCAGRCIRDLLARLLALNLKRAASE